MVYIHEIGGKRLSAMPTAKPTASHGCHIGAVPVVGYTIVLLEVNIRLFKQYSEQIDISWQF